MSSASESARKEYLRFLTELGRHTPDLSGFFHNTAAYLVRLGVSEEEALGPLESLTLASETVFIDVEAVVPPAVERGELERFSSILERLARSSPALARVFHARYPALRCPLERIERAVLALAESCAAERSPGAGDALALCLGMPEASAVAFLLDRFAVVASSSLGLLDEITASLAEKLRSLRWPVFAAWLDRGTDLLTSGHLDEGVRHLQLRSRESRLLLGLNHMVLDDVRDVLRIYCASLDGVSLGVSSLEASSFRIPGAYTDGKTIFLPPEIRYFDEQELNSRAYTVLAAVQAACVRMGTFGFDLSAIGFGDELLDRYGTQLPEILPNVRRSWSGLASAVREPSVGRIEVVFPSGRILLALETDLERFFYSFPTPDFARELFTLVENARIAWSLGTRYPGLREDLAMLDRYLWGCRPVLPPKSDDRVSLLRITVEELIRYTLVGSRSRRSRELEEAMAPVCRELERVRTPDASVEDSAEACFRMYNALFERFPLPAFCGRHPPAEVFAGAHRQLFYPEVVREVSPELLSEERTRARYGDLSKPDEEEIDLAAFSAHDVKAEELSRAVSSGHLKAFRYPEYNARKGAYEPSHCTLFERTLEPRDDSYYQSILAAHESVHKKIKKKFLTIRPEDLEISRRWLSGDDVHLSDAVDYSIEVLRGQCPDEKVYFRKVRNRRDIAVAILVDASSSTDEEIGLPKGSPNGLPKGSPKGSPAGSPRRVIDVEKAALSLLASALHLLGDTFGMFSYFSLGRRRVFFNVIKDFQEPWDPSTQARIPSVEAYASNRDGCAIRHATSRLLQCPEKSRLLILLSDGIPADIGYGAKTGASTTHYAIEDTRRAIGEARLAGIVPYCITVDRFAKRYIPHLYGEWSYTILHDVAVLPERLSRLYLKLTR